MHVGKQEVSSAQRRLAILCLPSLMTGSQVELSTDKQPIFVLLDELPIEADSKQYSNRRDEESVGCCYGTELVTLASNNLVCSVRAIMGVCRPAALKRRIVRVCVGTTVPYLPMLQLPNRLQISLLRNKGT